MASEPGYLGLTYDLFDWSEVEGSISSENEAKEELFIPPELEEDPNINHCPRRHGEHCPTCWLLPTSAWLSDGELANARCCGRGNCIAYPPHDHVDHLAPLLAFPANVYSPNNQKRYQFYRAWYSTANNLGVLPDLYTDQPDASGQLKRRYVWSACILQRVRCVWPSYQYTGHI